MSSGSRASAKGKEIEKVAIGKKKPRIPTVGKDAERARVVQELVETEESYVKRLEFLQQTFIGQLEWQLDNVPSPILSREELNQIFMNIKQIYTFHCVFLEMLQAKWREWDPNSEIGDLFTSQGGFLRLYNEYCRNYARALTTFTRLREENKKFDMFVQTAFLGHPDSHKLTIESFLIMPVQRIPRYELLLKEIRKYTEEGHPDRKNVEKAFVEVKKIADGVNKKMKDVEHAKTMWKLHDTLVGFSDPNGLVVAHRRYIFSGPLQFLQLENIIETDGRYTMMEGVLFSDVFVLSFKQGTQLIVTHEAYLSHVKVFDVPDLTHMKNVFHIVTVGNTFTVAASTPAEKKEWMGHLNETIAEYTDHRYSRKLAEEKSKDRNSWSSLDTAAEKHLSTASMQTTVTATESESQRPTSVASVDKDDVTLVEEGSYAFKGSVRIPRTSERKEVARINRIRTFTTYEIVLQISPDEEIQVKRRFREFKRLEEILRMKYPRDIEFKFPRKYLFGSQKQDNIEYRQVVLEGYLLAILHSPADIWEDEEVKKFLHKDSSYRPSHRMALLHFLKCCPR